MAVRGTWLLSGLLLTGIAHAGSAPAELRCVSDSGKVALEGAIPSPSSEELELKLRYADGSLSFNSNKNDSYVVEDFPKSVFTLVVAVRDAVPLTMYALPSSITVQKRENGDVAGKFQAKLTSARPRSATGVQADTPLKATLNCEYRYSL
ncbi:hypothetical protein LMG26858_02152 [Achromobacter anxifer]|uniref:Uncharacterized protein n=1 Tax=Achromobacter anxifer TaxID=1287737 RepID=A0A6S7CS49_9BURK|nr:hypothetical protein [Achromobacter anxifer]CAB3859663.1 hypothetical protein LMG26858_02152 [Achromobacter anxifer]